MPLLHAAAVVLQAAMLVYLTRLMRCLMQQQADARRDQAELLSVPPRTSLIRWVIRWSKWRDARRAS